MLSCYRVSPITVRQNKDVCSLEGLSGCPLLEAITVTECSLESMDGMEECSRVQRLNLSSNKITRISGLGAMTEVSQIWLNDNRITRLDGLSHLTNLSVRASSLRVSCKTCSVAMFVLPVGARLARFALPPCLCVSVVDPRVYIRCSRLPWLPWLVRGWGRWEVVTRHQSATSATRRHPPPAE